MPQSHEEEQASGGPVDVCSRAAPTILRLSIKRFRGVRSMVWRPGHGVNVVLGGGDVGKTTILDAIGLLLSPVSPSTVAETDYFRRGVADGFEIEAVMSLPASSGIADQAAHRGLGFGTAWILCSRQAMRSPDSRSTGCVFEAPRIWSSRTRFFSQTE